MKFFKLLYEEAGEGRLQLLIISLVPGIAMALVIAVVSTVTDYEQSEGLQWQLLAFFVLGCAVVLFTMNRALNAMTAIVAGYLSRMRIHIADQVRSLNLSAFESIGIVRIRNAVGHDLQTIEETAPAVVGLIYFTMQLIVSAIYIGYLSPTAFAVTMVFLAGAVYFYRRSYADAENLWRRASAGEAAFHKSFEHLLGGFKEVKLNSSRSEDLYANYIVARSELVEDLRIRSGKRFNHGQSISDVFFYALMGAMVFAIPHYVTDLSVPGKIITVIVFSSGAITSIVRTLPMVSRANLAVESLEALDEEFARRVKEAEKPVITEPASLGSGLTMRRLAYRYEARDGERGFSVGPCDLDIAAGELVFIVGGNGSGKSTFIKLMTRLYEPSDGVLLWDGAAVANGNVEAYRSLFSVIFTDFHLFDRLYGIDDIDPARVHALLKDMQLADKIAFRNGRFSTTDLSTGQRKRLAMIVALLEGRPVCVFDEWAADQDPDFRRSYYEALLPRLKAEGRTVIAITHDDRYFHLADKLVWMEEGRIVRVDVPQRALADADDGPSLHP